MPELYDYEKDCPQRDYDSFYLRLRRRVEDWSRRHMNDAAAELVLCVPDFFYLLMKLMGDAEVPRRCKAQCAAALAYFVSPIDVIPDVLGGLGWLDDLYVALLVVNSLLTSVDGEVLERYWLGDGDLILKARELIARLDEKLGSGAIRRIVAAFRSRMQE